MNGYSGRPGFGVMPPVGTNASLSSAEVTAIVNHERSTWGNNAKKVTEEEIKKNMKGLFTLFAPPLQINDKSLLKSNISEKDEVQYSL